MSYAGQTSYIEYLRERINALQLTLVERQNQIDALEYRVRMCHCHALQTEHSDEAINTNEQANALGDGEMREEIAPAETPLDESDNAAVGMHLTGVCFWKCQKPRKEQRIA